MLMVLNDKISTEATKTKMQVIFELQMLSL